MSNKERIEASILTQFLATRGLTFLPREDSDPHHDGWACRGNHRVAELELVRYVVDSTDQGSIRIATVKEWDRAIWPALAKRLRHVAELKNVKGQVDFAQVPKRSEFDLLLDEMMELIEQTWTHRESFPRLPGATQGMVRSVYIENGGESSECYRDETTATARVTPSDHPLFTKYVGLTYLFQSSDDWPEWKGPDMTGGTVVLGSEHFEQILTEKSCKLDKRGKVGDAAWLVIWSDRLIDVRTSIFPTHPAMVKAVRRTFAKSSSALAQSPFDEVWLYSAFLGEAFQLYPVGAEG